MGTHAATLQGGSWMWGRAPLLFKDLCWISQAAQKQMSFSACLTEGTQSKYHYPQNASKQTRNFGSECTVFCANRNLVHAALWSRHHGRQAWCMATMQGKAQMQAQNSHRCKELQRLTGHSNYPMRDHTQGGPNLQGTTQRQDNLAPARTHRNK